MTFSINQVRHLFVGKNLVSTLPTKVGDIYPKGDNNKKILYFQCKSPAGLISSDIIDTDKIMSISATKSKKLAHNLKLVKVTLDSDPIAGQEYILRINYTGFLAIGDENTYVEYGDVKVSGTMDASSFYKKMALSIAKNTNNLITVYLGTSSSQTKVTKDTKEDSLTDTYTSLLFEEKEQDWELGVVPEAYVKFNITAAPIISNGEETEWCTIDSTVASINKVENGHNIADLEYFCMGARGDYYRGMGFPYTIKTKYLVDPDNKYDVLDIHYYSSGSNESVQKSEKDLTIVFEDDGKNTKMTTLVEAVNKLLPADKQVTLK